MSPALLVGVVVMDAKTTKCSLYRTQYLWLDLSVGSESNIGCTRNHYKATLRCVPLQEQSLEMLRPKICHVVGTWAMAQAERALRDVVLKPHRRGIQMPDLSDSTSVPDTTCSSSVVYQLACELATVAPSHIDQSIDRAASAR